MIPDNFIEGLFYAQLDNGAISWWHQNVNFIFGFQQNTDPSSGANPKMQVYEFINGNSKI